MARIDAGTEAILNLGARTFTKPGKSRSAVLNPTCDLRVRVGRERNLNEVDDPVGVTGELVDIGACIQASTSVADSPKKPEVFASVLSGALEFGRRTRGKGFPPIPSIQVFRTG